MFKGLNALFIYSTVLVSLWFLDYPKVNSLCYSAVLIPWFPMNYEGRVLGQIADRMVSDNSVLFLSTPGFFTQFSHRILTLCAHKCEASFPGHLTRPTPAEYLLSCAIPSLSTAATDQSLQDLKDLVAIRKLSWSWIVAWFRFKAVSFFVCP